MDPDELLRVLRAFEAVGLDYFLIGATAMGFHGVVRATEDVDLILRPDIDNIGRLSAALGEVCGDDPHVEDEREMGFRGVFHRKPASR